MGRPRKAEKKRASYRDLASAAGEGINGGREAWQRYHEIKNAGGDPEIFYSRRDGYSVIDGLARDILLNRMRHG